MVTSVKFLNKTTVIVENPNNMVIMVTYIKFLNKNPVIVELLPESPDEAVRLPSTSSAWSNRHLGCLGFRV